MQRQYCSPPTRLQCVDTSFYTLLKLPWSEEGNRMNLSCLSQAFFPALKYFLWLFCTSSNSFPPTLMSWLGGRQVFLHLKYGTKALEPVYENVQVSGFSTTSFFHNQKPKDGK